LPHSEPISLEAEVLNYREIHELPGDWGPEALLRLLTDLEVDVQGVDEGDLLDLALMALGDLEPDDAGVAVLGVVFGEGMSAGLRGNLAADLEGDRPWEEFADLSRQAGIFSATVLLQKALPRLFGKPDASWAEVAFRASSAAEAAIFLKAPAATTLRALGPGFGPRSIVTRLYAEGMRGGPFPEAEQILWRRTLKADPGDPRRVLAEVYGAQSFLGALEEAAPWQVKVIPG